MKESTKARLEGKLLQWFRKVFKYAPHIEPWVVEERKIQKIRSTHELSPFEKSRLNKMEEEILNVIKTDMAVGMAKVMLNIGAIKFEIENDMTNNSPTRIVATTFVPEKL
jgi:hypothetical protein